MDTFQNPKANFWDMAFHQPHDMQSFYRMHNVKRLTTRPHTPGPVESSRDGCTIVQEVSLGARGCSLQESGPDHSGTYQSCPVHAQGGDSEKHTGNLKWQDAYGFCHVTETKRSLGPSFHESRAADIHANRAGPLH